MKQVFLLFYIPRTLLVTFGLAHRYLNQLLTEAATISSLFILVGTQTDVLLESAHYCHARTSLVTLPLPDWKTRHRVSQW